MMKKKKKKGGKKPHPIRGTSTNSKTQCRVKQKFCIVDRSDFPPEHELWNQVFETFDTAVDYEEGTVVGYEGRKPNALGKLKVYNTKQLRGALTRIPQEI